MQALVRLGAYREFAGYFGRLEGLSDDDKATLTWFVKQPRFFATLMLALSDADPPDQMLVELAHLKSSAGDAVDAFPDLATALCVVWDKKPDNADDPAPDPDRIARLFSYYAKAGDRGLLRFGTRTLPWQLAVYVVDNKVSEGEIVWAIDRYANRSMLGTTYFDVAYDTAAYYTGDRKQLAGHPYTLPNILQYGGICADQAYFAAHVCKSLGVPACVVSGSGGDGSVAHAWVGYLHVTNARADWNFTEGRYPEHQYWTGSVQDPQTLQTLSEAEVALLAELQASDPGQRLASEALLKLATPTPAHPDGSPPDGSPADAYPTVLPPSKQLEVCSAAVVLSPGNRRAWAALADVAAKGDLTPPQTQSVAAVIARFALQKYPDFALRLYTTMAAGRPPAQQLDTLEKCARLFAPRPDLVARLRVAEGDLLRKQRKNDQALRPYGDVLDNEMNAGRVVVEAMGRVDDLLREMNDRRRLVAAYKAVWQRMPVPEPSAFVATTPYYAVGIKFAALLDEAGDKPDADQVRTKLESLDGATAAGNGVR